MNCIGAEFSFYDKGVQIKTHSSSQASDISLTYIPYRVIQTVRFSEYKDDKEAQITIRCGSADTLYQWVFRDAEYARMVYTTLIEKI